MIYDYEQLKKDASRLASAYKDTDLFSIGESVAEQKLYCIKIGDGRKKLFINGAHHGLEYLTSAFIMKFLADYAKCIYKGTDMFGYNTGFLSEQTSLFAVPMVNPDGVEIAAHGIDFANPYHKKLINIVGIHNFGKVWQANINGVDINHNYNAGWRVVKEHPSPSRYSGSYAESEPETKAIVNFVRKIGFDMLIAFHSQGGEIYYNFNEKMPKNSKYIADKFAEVSGYIPSVPTGSACFGGCKDWFIDEFDKPGFTIEIGHGENPLPLEMLDSIYEENAKIILCALESLA